MTLIDRAAEAVGKNRSELMFNAATREATAVLLDRHFFQLKRDAWVLRPVSGRVTGVR